MPLLSAVILAQVVTAGVGDRQEVRAVSEPGNERLEAENLPYASAALTLPALTLRATYAPSLLLSPLERSPRSFDLTHTLTGIASSTLTIYESRRVAVQLNANGNFTQQDYRRDLLGPTVRTAPDSPPPPPGTSNVGFADASRANGLTTRTGTASADVTATERVSRAGTLREYVMYLVSSGLDDESRDLFPLAHGPEAGASFVYLASRRDTFVTSSIGQLVFVPRTGERALRVDLTQTYNHAFSRATSGDAELGAVYTRSESRESEPSNGVSPLARLGVKYETTLGQGKLSLRLQLSYEPILDRSAFVFDPRFTVFGNADWVRKRWTIYAATNSNVSLDPNEPGSLTSLSANAGADYSIGSGFVAHAGVRFAAQSFAGKEELPPTWVGFLALSWNYEIL